jgi:phasin family protein
MYNGAHSQTYTGDDAMTDRTFDPNAMMAAAREAFAPVLKAQQEGFKTFERLARLHYAVAGDVLESNIARVNASFAATSPTELFSKHTELNTQLVDKLRARAEEFATVTSEIQTKFTQIGSEIAAKAVPARKAA